MSAGELGVERWEIIIGDSGDHDGHYDYGNDDHDGHYGDDDDSNANQMVNRMVKIIMMWEGEYAK